MVDSNTETQHTNHLINEKSPYLQQHAHNPVDWYPWGEEAFRLSKALDKPILLSIGYSTCHWCHVMEHESFEDERVAKLLNDTFVCIKVDREERPDVDSIYMHFCQATTGSGGWPLNVILTPEKKPVFAMTYMPKTTRRGIMGVVEMAESVGELWKNQRNELIERSESILQELRKMTRSVKKDQEFPGITDTAFRKFKESFDSTSGGFGGSPKFPSPHNLIFLLRYHRKNGNAEALEMVEKTLIRMRMGGIFDQVGFGFHRYSTDPFWIVPHFEKMLYDQAMLIWAYSEAFTVTGKNFYRETAYEIYEFLQRDMRDSKGVYYTAIDADSEGIEGKYYLWKKGEIQKVVTGEMEDFTEMFNIAQGGNFNVSEGNIPPGENILYVTDMTEEEAVKRPWDSKDIRGVLELLRKERESRVMPGIDRKILTDLNALLAFSFIRAAGAFEDRKLLDSGLEILSFIEKKMFGNGGILMHSYMNGTSEIEGFLDDYSFLTAALIEAFQATGDEEYLISASNLEKHLDLHFRDDNGGYYLAADYELSNILRMKPGMDGAMPSGNSFQMINLVNMSQILENQNYLEKAADIPLTLSDSLEAAPRFHSLLIAGMDHMSNHFAVRKVVKSGEEFKEYCKLSKAYRTDTVFIPVRENGDYKLEVMKALSTDLKKGVYQLCSGTECYMPADTLDEALSSSETGN